MILKIVYEKMIELLGRPEPLRLDKTPSVIMLVGLQGAGKTTTAVKLAGFLKKKGRNPFLIPADVKRPAAFEQLRDLAERNGFPVFTKRMDNAVRLSKAALTQSVLKRYDTLIFDTAGRLHIDEEMIDEAIKIKESVKPSEVLLVVDGMTGQDAVNIAGEFDQKIGITGVILTKMDGDTRGGAAMSVRKVTGKPIKFLGVIEFIIASVFINSFSSIIFFRSCPPGIISSICSKEPIFLNAFICSRKSFRSSSALFNFS